MTAPVNLSERRSRRVRAGSPPPSSGFQPLVSLPMAKQQHRPLTGWRLAALVVSVAATASAFYLKS